MEKVNKQKKKRKQKSRKRNKRPQENLVRSNQRKCKSEYGVRFEMLSGIMSARSIKVVVSKDLYIYVRYRNLIEGVLQFVKIISHLHTNLY